MSSEQTQPRRRSATIGLRLTLWGMGMTLTVCVLFCILLYTGMYYSLLREIDGFLQDEVRELAARVKEYPTDLRAAEQAIRVELGHRVGADLSFRLFDQSGRVLITSEPQDPRADQLSRVATKARPGGQPFFETVTVPDSPHALRTCAFHVFGSTGTPRVAQTAYSLHRMKHSLALLRKMSVFGLGFAAILALVGGWVLTRKTLLPINAMTVKARHIEADQLTDRLPRSGTGDELDRLAETLNEMLARIEDHVRQIRQFTADASHEFRSPLAALRGMAEVALTKPRSADELRQVIEVSIEQYDRLHRLAEDLLLLARADTDRAGLRRESVRLHDVIRDAAELYAPVAEEAGLTLDVGPLADVELSGDGGRLRQMIGNLIDNAIKYNRAPGTIEVALHSRDGTAMVLVRDTGQGITPEDLPHIFDRFYRGDKARASPGTGLGLAISQWIAKAHGGRIEVTSQQGRGTTVQVHLPTWGAQASGR